MEAKVRIPQRLQALAYLRWVYLYLVGSMNTAPLDLTQEELSIIGHALQTYPVAESRFTHPITFVLMHKNCGDALLMRQSKEGKS